MPNSYLEYFSFSFIHGDFICHQETDKLLQWKFYEILSFLNCHHLSFSILWKGPMNFAHNISISDVDQPKNTSKDPLHVPNGPMTRSKTKASKEALKALVLNVSTKSELKGSLEYQEETLVHLIHVQEGSNTTFFGPWGEDNKGNKNILLQLGNNMGGYLFLLFLGLRGCMEGYK